MKTERCEIRIRGMICRSCTDEVSGMLLRTKGVIKSTVSYRKALAAVSFDPALVSPEELEKRIKSLGYDTGERSLAERFLDLGCAALTVLLVWLLSGRPWAAALLGGGVFALVSGGTLRQLAIYALGNLACLLTLPVLRGTGKERIRSDKLLTLLFALGVCLLMQLGRAAAALAMGTEPGLCAGFFTTDALSALFAMVIVSLARRLDGLFEDQKCYLLRCQRQRDKEKGGF